MDQNPILQILLVNGGHVVIIPLRNVDTRILLMPQILVSQLLIPAHHPFVVYCVRNSVVLRAFFLVIYNSSFDRLVYLIIVV